MFDSVDSLTLYQGLSQRNILWLGEELELFEINHKWVSIRNYKHIGCGAQKKSFTVRFVLFTARDTVVAVM